MVKAPLPRGEEESPFGCISYEMVLDILQYLSHRDKKKCRLVCQRWRILLDNSRRYFSFRPKLNNKSIMAFIDSYRPMDQVIFQNINKMKIPSTARPHFQFLNKGILGWRNSKKNIVQFLKFCGHSQSLAITKFALGKISQTAIRDTLQEIAWNNLNRLKLEIILTKYKLSRAQTHRKNCIVLFKTVKLPKLKEFELDFAHKNPNHRLRRQVAFRLVCRGLYQFISNHSTSLKSLIVGIRVLRNPKRFRIPKIPELVKESIGLNLKLDKCSFGLWGVKHIQNLILPSIFGRNLKTLELRTYAGNLDNPDKRRKRLKQSGVPRGISSALERNMAQIFEENGKSLRNVIFSDCDYMKFNSRAPPVNLLWFETCTKLETIILKPTNGRYLFNMNISPLIFEASSRSLRTVEIEVPVPKLSWFRNCTQLESLSVTSGHDFGEQAFQPQDMLPPMRLKKLIINIRFPQNPCLCQIQEFIDRSGKTLEILDLDRMTVMREFNDFSFSLSSCFALKYIRTSISLEKSISQTSGLNFKNLTEIEIHIEPMMENLINWITDSMKNLERIGLLDFFSAFGHLAKIQQLLDLPKSKEIRILSNSFGVGRNLNRIFKFVQNNPGLSTKSWERSDKYGILVLVDHSAYVHRIQNRLDYV